MSTQTSLFVRRALRSSRAPSNSEKMGRGAKSDSLLVSRVFRLPAVLIAANLMFILCSLPVVTLNAASHALHAMLEAERRGESRVFATFIAEFRAELSARVKLGLSSVVAVLLVGFVGWRLSSDLGSTVVISMISALLIICVVMINIASIRANLENVTQIQSLKIALSHFKSNPKSTYQLLFLLIISTYLALRSPLFVVSGCISVPFFVAVWLDGKASSPSV